jgi:valyl-tRNA synthetase
MASSQDVRYSAEKVRQGQELANKLWNASRLILLRVADVEPAPRPETVEDRWILSRLERLTERVTGLIDNYEFSRAALELYGAFWGEVCDWYLELVKPRLYEDPSEDLSATLLHVLERMLQLLHPIMPFVTEEIWAHMPGERGLLAVAPWPEVRQDLLDDDSEKAVERVIEAVTALRRYRDDVGAPAAARIPAVLEADGYDAPVAEQIARLARCEWSTNGASAEAVASISVPGGDVKVLATEAIDPEEAAKRLAAHRAKLTEEIKRAEAKLANEKFVERAPEDVVAAEREKLERYRGELQRLDESE